MTARMNTGERQALRQVVRQRMKVLRADVAARKAELVNEIEQRVAEKFAAQDTAVAQANTQIEELIKTAIMQMRTIATELEVGLNLGPNTVGISAYPSVPQIGIRNNDKLAMRRRLHAEVESQVSAALLDIDRREADLLEELTVDGLETDAAKDFLGRIPTVAQLVPATRLREISA